MPNITPAIRPSCRACALVLLPLLACLVDASAASKTTQMNVSANVQPMLSLTMQSQPSTFTVTQADLKNGYVDVPNAGSYAVINNNRNGYQLSFQTRDFGALSIKGVTVTSGLARPAELKSNANTVTVQPYTALKSTVNLSMRISFVSSTDAAATKGPDKPGELDKMKAGTYPWPVLLVTAPPF